jgi:hypothetical protein
MFVFAADAFILRQTLWKSTEAGMYVGITAIFLAGSPIRSGRDGT